MLCDGIEDGMNWSKNNLEVISLSSQCGKLAISFNISAPVQCPRAFKVAIGRVRYYPVRAPVPSSSSAGAG